MAQIFRVTSTLTADGQERDYLVKGQIFFAAAEDFMAAFDFREPVKRVRIDVSRSHIWDLTGVKAVDRAVLKFRREAVEVQVVGHNEASTTIMDKLSVHNEPRALEKFFRR